MSTFKAFVVRPDGTSEAVEWEPSSDRPNYKHLQHHVGGLIDVIELTQDMDAWVNDEGLLHGLEPNVVGSFLVSYLSGQALAGALVGPIVFTGGSDDEGETLPLTDEAVTLLSQVCETLLGLQA